MRMMGSEGNVGADEQAATGPQVGMRRAIGTVRRERPKLVVTTPAGVAAARNTRSATCFLTSEVKPLAPNRMPAQKCPRKLDVANRPAPPNHRRNHDDAHPRVSLVGDSLWGEKEWEA